MKSYDLITIGAGPCGIMTNIMAARSGLNCLLLERNSGIGAKLKASGGGRCNLANTLSIKEFIARYGKDGRFMHSTLNKFYNKELLELLSSLDVPCHALDGFRYFPTTHSSETVITGLENELERLKIDIRLNHRVKKVEKSESLEKNINLEKVTQGWLVDNKFLAQNLLIATGGISFKALGTDGDGLNFAKALGHSITPLYPAMLPVHTKEAWVANCRENTLGKAVLTINLKGHRNKSISGDIIFTKTGLRGPAVLDLSREITPLLAQQKEVPLLLNVVHGYNQQELTEHINGLKPDLNLARPFEVFKKFMAKDLCTELCLQLGINPNKPYGQLSKQDRTNLIQLATKLPLTAIGTDGFDTAMVTRGGICLKEVNPLTLESKLHKSLYFGGEILDLDGPCGGFNLQWAFSSAATIAASITQT
jgi:predicted Rossmann fold flavoprotein